LNIRSVSHQSVAVQSQRRCASQQWPKINPWKEFLVFRPMYCFSVICHDLPFLQLQNLTRLVTHNHHPISCRTFHRKAMMTSLSSLLPSNWSHVALLENMRGTLLRQYRCNLLLFIRRNWIMSCVLYECGSQETILNIASEACRNCLLSTTTYQVRNDLITCKDLERLERVSDNFRSPTSSQPRFPDLGLAGHQSVLSRKYVTNLYNFYTCYITSWIRLPRRQVGPSWAKLPYFVSHVQSPGQRVSSLPKWSLG
jgi:hypothetical protein